MSKPKGFRVKVTDVLIKSMTFPEINHSLPIFAEMDLIRAVVPAPWKAGLVRLRVRMLAFPP